MTNTRICPKPDCKTQCGRNARFCSRCGAPLPKAGTTPPEAQTPAPQGGRIIDGRYQLISILGEGGGQAPVWRAYEIDLKREVAIKVLSYAIRIRDESWEGLFRREMEAQARLGHPNIARLYQFIEDGDDLCLVMELIPGETLAQYLKRPENQQGLTLYEALGLMSTIADAISHAHGRGVIHRDLKPGNILLEEGDPEHPKVIDFGISRLIGEKPLTKVGIARGTLEYMSPEGCAALPNITERADVYSLGVMLFEMLTGRLPFSADPSDGGAYMNALLYAHQFQPPPRLCAQPGFANMRDLDALIAGMLAKRPEDRPSCQEVVLRIERILSQRQERPAEDEVGRALTQSVTDEGKTVMLPARVQTTVHLGRRAEETQARAVAVADSCLEQLGPALLDLALGESAVPAFAELQERQRAFHALVEEISVLRTRRQRHESDSAARDGEARQALFQLLFAQRDQAGARAVIEERIADKVRAQAEMQRQDQRQSRELGAALREAQAQRPERISAYLRGTLALSEASLQVRWPLLRRRTRQRLAELVVEGRLLCDMLVDRPHG